MKSNLEGGGNYRYKKLEMPTFDGENLDAWLFRAELFFEIHQVKEFEKVNVVVVSFQKDIVDWYRWTNNRKPVKSGGPQSQNVQSVSANSGGKFMCEISGD